MAGVLFEDIFDVKDIDPDGKKFDRGKSWLGGVFIDNLQGQYILKSAKFLFQIIANGR